MRRSRASWPAGLAPVLWAVMLTALWLGAVGAAWAKQPAPPPEVLSAARAAHREELDKAKTSADKLRLSGQWAIAATNSGDDPKNRYVLKMLAAETAAQAGDVTTAFSYAQDLDAAYTIDLLALKLDLLGKAAKGASSKVQVAAVVAQAKALLTEAAAADRYDEAVQAGDLGIAVAHAARDWPTAKQLVAAKKELEEPAAGLASVQGALRQLEGQPLDPQANTDYGKFLCFVKGDWDVGVTMLALGGDEALKTPAVKELRAGSDPAAQLAVADAWWDLADKQSEPARKRVRQHAGACYRLAQPGLAEADKPRVAQRLAALEGAEPAAGAAPAAAAKLPAGSSPRDKDAEALAAAAKLRAKARAAKKPFSLVLTNEAAVRKDWKLPTQETEWTIVPLGLKLKGLNATSLESQFTLSGDCELSLTVSAHCTDPPAIQFFGEEITPPRPAVVTSYQEPYVWRVNIMRRGPTLTAAVGTVRIGTFTIKEDQRALPTRLALSYGRSGFGMLLMAVTIRANEFNAGP